MPAGAGGGVGVHSEVSVWGSFDEWRKPGRQLQYDERASAFTLTLPRSFAKVGDEYKFKVDSAWIEGPNEVVRAAETG
jgi:1,4-alpha-glucan branching enzyme